MMKKDIEWLKKKIGGLPCVGTTFNRYGHGPSYIASAVSVMAVYDLIDKLDEPEVLSQEWIDSNSVYASFDGVTEEYVHVDDLKELLMPKQELPVIPKFVADWIEEMKQDERPLYSAMSSLLNKTNHTWSVWKSANKNFSEIMAQAWLNGYTVEEEQEYIVVLGKSIYNTTTYGQIGEVNSKKIMQSVYANEEGIIAPSQYRKSEILEVKDGGSIFKRFAVKVEEIE